MSTVVFTKEGWKTSVAFVLFENAMCVVKLSAMISGLFELSDAHEWVVTKKLGNMFSSSSSSSSSSTPKVRRKIYFKELSMGSFFLFCGVYGILQHQLVHYSLFLIAQSLVFFAFGFNRVTF
jgi:beta-mannan synthase